MFCRKLLQANCTVIGGSSIKDTQNHPHEQLIAKSQESSDLESKMVTQVVKDNTTSQSELSIKSSDLKTLQDFHKDKRVCCSPRKRPSDLVLIGAKESKVARKISCSSYLDENVNENEANSFPWFYKVRHEDSDASEVLSIQVRQYSLLWLKSFVLFCFDFSLETNIKT